jgi:hypothetical protein
MAVTVASVEKVRQRRPVCRCDLPQLVEVIEVAQCLTQLFQRISALVRVAQMYAQDLQDDEDGG